MKVLMAFAAAGANVKVNTHLAKIVLLFSVKVFEAFAAVEVRLAVCEKHYNANNSIWLQIKWC